MFIDSHCHLNFGEFKNDYKQAIQKARDSRVEKMVVVGSNFATSQKAIQIAQEFPDICFAAIGLHPIHVLDEEFVEEFENLADKKEVVAIGEVGLDYFRLSKGTEEKIKQEEIFLKFFDLAKKLNKPVILHCRDAYSDLLQILQDFEGIKKIKKVLHCYDGNLKYLDDFLALSCLISFTGNVTYGDQRDQAIRRIPTNMLMIETDAPYLTPESYYGKKNHPAYVIEVAKYIAKIKKIELAQLEKILQKTTEEFFDI